MACGVLLGAWVGVAGLVFRGGGFCGFGWFSVFPEFGVFVCGWYNITSVVLVWCFSHEVCAAWGLGGLILIFCVLAQGWLYFHDFPVLCGVGII